jgi:hypothetical protein
MQKQDDWCLVAKLSPGSAGYVSKIEVYEITIRCFQAVAAEIDAVFGAQDVGEDGLEVGIA